MFFIGCPQTLEALFGPTYEPGSDHRKNPDIFSAHAEIIRLATGGRVRVASSDVRYGPSGSRAVGPFVAKKKKGSKTSPYEINGALLAHYGVTGAEVLALFEKAWGP